MNSIAGMQVQGRSSWVTSGHGHKVMGSVSNS